MTIKVQLAELERRHKALEDEIAEALGPHPSKNVNPSAIACKSYDRNGLRTAYR